MGFKFVFLWTDVALYALFVALVIYVWRVIQQPALQANWKKVLHDPAALSAGLLLLIFTSITALDSVHFRSALKPTAGASATTPIYYDTRTESLLDRVLARQMAMREITYSAPMAYLGITKESLEVDGKTVRDYPRLKFGGVHLASPDHEWSGDVIGRVVTGLIGGVAVFVVVLLFVGFTIRHAHGGVVNALRDIAADRTHYPLRAMAGTLMVVCLVGGVVAALMNHYHVFGTDRTGNDVLYLSLKSVRTAFVIGALSTLATLPLAVALGILAGYFRGWVDEVIQYLYTTLTSVPNVLLIAACVLMVQVFLDQHPEMFETGVERSDLKIFLLCMILGLTGWATLCRLVRGETLKLRELDYVQAATAFGVSHTRIMARHILPNVMHLVLITTVLGFSDLILYEAVLTYVGVGVDPSMSSFGGMINLARSEMSREPTVWWLFAAAFIFMVTLVLAANLFADGVRDAFDPRSRNFRPRVITALSGRAVKPVANP